MNTDLMPHKSVLFLISLSQNKIQEIGNKGVDYQLFMKTIRSYSHVEVHEAISEKLLSSASLYEVVVIVGHQLNGCIEMADGSLFPMSNIVSALPSTFSGYLHVAVCGSSVIWDAIKEHCVDSRVRASKRSTQLELQLLIYSLLLSRTDLNKDTFDYWYVFERDYIKELQKRRNPADLAKLPCATKLGEEKDIATSVFAPKEVKATYKFPIQVFLYFDSEKGTLVAKAKAEGIDPDTMPRLIQEPLKNIHAGDMIDVRLTMLDKDNQPTHNILIFYQEGTFSMPVKIGEKETKVSFDVNITEQYLYEECWAQLSFINNSNNEKQCLNLEPFKIKIKIPEKRVKYDNNTYRKGISIGGNKGWQSKQPNRGISKNYSKPRETMTFLRKSGVTEAHLSLLYQKLTKLKEGDEEGEGWIEGNEADFKALFSGKRDEDCELKWKGVFGKGTLVELFKQLTRAGLIEVANGFTISSILEGHFKNTAGVWLTGLNKGNAANDKAFPVIQECIRLLKVNPEKMFYGDFDDDEDFQSKYDPWDHQDLNYNSK